MPGVEETGNPSPRKTLVSIRQTGYIFQIVSAAGRYPETSFFGGSGIQSQFLTIPRQSPDTDVIIMTAHGSVKDAIDCLRQGASEYILKPFDMDDLVIRVSRKSLLGMLLNDAMIFSGS